MTADQRGRRVVEVGALDHIVLAVADPMASCRFYARVLGMEPREERPGKWSLHFGANKISLQDARSMPDIGRATVAGSGNFCVLTDVPIDEVVAHLAREDVAVVDGPGVRAGATGALLSVYFKDPDGNLVEVANRQRGARWDDLFRGGSKASEDLMKERAQPEAEDRAPL